jgi:subtilisin family serine protease
MTQNGIILLVRLSVLCLILVVFAGAAAQRSFRYEHTFRNNRAEQVDGELLVKFKKHSAYAKKLSSIRAHGSTRLREFSRTGYIHVKLRPGLSVADAMKLYASDPDVEAVQPNVRYAAAALPNDPAFASQWGFKNSAQTVATPSYTLADGSAIANPGTAGCDMNLGSAWNEITDCRAVIVAVLDTGVNYDHEDLANNMWDGSTAYPHHGYDFTGGGSDDPMDLNGHGTMVAGIIGAEGNNGRGGTGVCWRASIMAVKVLDAAGNGTSASVVDGINFALSHGAKVINMSLVTHVFDQAVYDAIQGAKENGVLVVAAAGNDAADVDDASGETSYPGAYDLDNIICVTALDQNYALARFSNYGAARVDIGAPGVNSANVWAGTTASIAETFSTGWTGGDTNHPGTSGWGSTYETDIECPSIKQYCLINPSFDEYYKNNIKDRAFRDYAPFAKTADGIVLRFAAQYSFYDSGDWLGVYIKNTAYDPLPADSVKIDDFRGGTGKRSSAYDLTSLVKGKDNFKIMYYLSTNETGNAASGIMISDMTVTGLWLSATAYSNYSGTSVSAAHVTGLAAMLFAFNPDYTYTDVAQSIYAGARRVAALKSVTRTGCAADAEGALEYLSAPEGVGSELVKD